MFDEKQIPMVYKNRTEQTAFQHAVTCIYYGFDRSCWNYLCLDKCKQNEVWKKACDFWKSKKNGHFCEDCKYFVKDLNLCNYSVPVSCMALDETCIYFEEVNKND